MQNRNSPILRKPLSFGARPLRDLRIRLMARGVEALPVSWRRPWIIQRILATVPWADFVTIRRKYAEAADLSAMTGKLYVVDHIIPLNHPRVCGLHLAINLQVVTYAVNSQKSNYFCPEQQDLFGFDPQLELNL